MEIWKAIPGYEGLYEASSYGNIRSLDRITQGRHGPTLYKGKVLKQGNGKYRVVALSKAGGKPITFNVHSLILTTFVGPAPPGCEVCHGPAGGHDNSLDNLRWDTRIENMADKKRFANGQDQQQDKGESR